jgi:hypothetical protein
VTTIPFPSGRGLRRGVPKDYLHFCIVPTFRRSVTLERHRLRSHFNALWVRRSVGTIMKNTEIYNVFLEVCA